MYITYIYIFLILLNYIYIYILLKGETVVNTSWKKSRESNHLIKVSKGKGRKTFSRKTYQEPNVC